MLCRRTSPAPLQNVQICTRMIDRAIWRQQSMMKPPDAMTQVREGNFSDEIADGISSALMVLYRTGCQGRCGVFRLHSDAQNGSTSDLDGHLSC
jgi:hypothetical protein